MQGLLFIYLVSIIFGVILAGIVQTRSGGFFEKHRNPIEWGCALLLAATLIAATIVLVFKWPTFRFYWWTKELLQMTTLILWGSIVGTLLRKWLSGTGIRSFRAFDTSTFFAREKFWIVGLGAAFLLGAAGALLGGRDTNMRSLNYGSLSIQFAAHSQQAFVDIAPIYFEKVLSHATVHIRDYLTELDAEKRVFLNSGNVFPNKQTFDAAYDNAKRFLQNNVGPVALCISELQTQAYSDDVIRVALGSFPAVYLHTLYNLQDGTAVADAGNISTLRLMLHDSLRTAETNLKKIPPIDHNVTVGGVVARGTQSASPTESTCRDFHDTIHYDLPLLVYNPDVFLSCARLLVYDGQLSKAIELLQYTSKRFPYDPEVHKYLGFLLYYRHAPWDEVIEQFKTGLNWANKLNKWGDATFKQTNADTIYWLKTALIQVYVYSGKRIPHTILKYGDEVEECDYKMCSDWTKSERLAARANGALAKLAVGAQHNDKELMEKALEMLEDARDEIDPNTDNGTVVQINTFYVAAQEMLGIPN